jgi:hypothetical protein
VTRAERECAEDQKVQRPLRKVNVLFRHLCPLVLLQQHRIRFLGEVQGGAACGVSRSGATYDSLKCENYMTSDEGTAGSARRGPEGMADPSSDAVLPDVAVARFGRRCKMMP